MKNLKKYRISKDLFDQYFFVFCLCVLSFNYGFLTYQQKIFPYSLIIQAGQGMNTLLSLGIGEWYYRKTEYTTAVPIYNHSAAHNGLSLITSIANNRSQVVKVIDMAGESIHEWEIDWFTMWPDATHIPSSDPYLPHTRPGAQVHGAELLDNGDLVFNFDYLGMLRLDLCGNVVWRLPYRTHHSMYRDEHGTLWVAGLIHHEQPLNDYPNYEPPFIEPTILNLSQEGEVLREISLFDVLEKNNLSGLMYIFSRREPADERTGVSGDPLHLNDVETFPSFLAEGIFKVGDIMLSLRNINTILVFRPSDLNVTHIITGDFVGQHDPDFVDGNTISIYDNHLFKADKQGQQSRILLQSLTDNQARVYYAGTEETPFFSHIMGKHQWLPNGNLLITEAVQGRAFEIDRQGAIVWEYVNLVEDGYVGVIGEAQRLPSTITEAFFAERIQKCSTAMLPGSAG